MEDILSKALEFSNFQHSITLQRKSLKERNESRLTFGYGGGVFKIDQSLISFVNTIVGKGRTSNVVVLDMNSNPVLVEDLETFLDDILGRYYESTLAYYDEYQKIKSKRSVEKLLDL